MNKYYLIVISLFFLLPSVSHATSVNAGSYVAETDTMTVTCDNGSHYWYMYYVDPNGGATNPGGGMYGHGILCGGGENVVHLYDIPPYSTLTEGSKLYAIQETTLNSTCDAQTTFNSCGGQGTQVDNSGTFTITKTTPTPPTPPANCPTDLDVIGCTIYLYTGYFLVKITLWLLFLCVILAVPFNFLKGSTK